MKWKLKCTVQWLVYILTRKTNTGAFHLKWTLWDQKKSVHLSKVHCLFFLKYCQKMVFFSFKKCPLFLKNFQMTSYLKWSLFFVKGKVFISIIRGKNLLKMQTKIAAGILDVFTFGGLHCTLLEQHRETATYFQYYCPYYCLFLLFVSLDNTSSILFVLIVLWYPIGHISIRTNGAVKSYLMK